MTDPFNVPPFSTPPVRILYFGSRTWLDAKPGDTFDAACAWQRRGYLFRGPLSRIMQAQLEQDIAAHPEGITLIEGEQVGADIMARQLVDGNPGISVDPYPIDTRVDGPWPWAPNRRNARMDRDGRPQKARCFASGDIGTPISTGSADMLAILRKRGVPVIIHRENGVQPEAQMGLFDRVRP